MTVAGVPVVTVNETDAQDTLLTIDALSARWARTIDAALQQGRDRRLSPWRRFSTEVQSSVEAAFARLLESASTIIPRALAVLLVLGLFWLLGTVVRRPMRDLFRRIVDDLTVENLIKQLAY